MINSQSVVDLLNEQIRNELHSQAVYLAMSAWFESAPFKENRSRLSRPCGTRRRESHRPPRTRREGRASGPRAVMSRKSAALLACLVLAGCANFRAERDAVARIDTRSLERARVIFAGERHDADAHHRFQLALIETLRKQGRPLAVGLEMVDVTRQPALDDYLADRIGWREFSRDADFSGWESQSRWYRKILEWCRRAHVPVLALNAPRSATRKLAAGRPLTADEQRLIPGFPEPPGGFDAFRRLLPPDHGGSLDLRRYYAAQRAWDQVMALRILDFLAHSDATLVVLLGAGHADAKHGVPWYVRRESDAAQLVLQLR